MNIKEIVLILTCVSYWIFATLLIIIGFKKSLVRQGDASEWDDFRNKIRPWAIGAILTGGILNIIYIILTA